MTCPIFSRSLLVACIAVAGCASADPDPADPQPVMPVTPAPEAAPSPPIAESPSGPGLQRAIEAAMADAAKQSGLARSEVKLLSAGVVTWPDGSLGCPSPGATYTQALVPGYRIRIQAGERDLDYHASARGGLVLCPPGRSIEPLQGEAM